MSGGACQTTSAKACCRAPFGFSAPRPKNFARKIFVGPEGWINFTTASAICAELDVVAEKEDAGALPM